MPASAARPDPDLTVLSRVFRHPETLAQDDLPHVQASGQSGAVYFALPPTHPLRPLLRPAMLGLALRHSQIRAELRPLLAAWAAEGIDALLFKGFALAEFEYPNPAARFYGDVDVLLPAAPEVVWRAVHLAMAHGWRSDGQHADPESWTHESAHLFSPGGSVRIDVHRTVVSFSNGLSRARAEALTAGFRARAIRHDWEGVPVLRPAPADAAVLNLALARTWGGDIGGVKPADYTDLRLLTARHGLSEQQLREHAASLGGAATWAAFLEQCDPGRGLLELDPERSGPPLRAAARQDGLRPRRALWGLRLKFVRETADLVPTALLDLAWAARAVRRGGDPRKHLSRVGVSVPLRRLSRGQVERRILAVGLLTRLFYPRQRKLGVCVPRAYAAYRLLRRAGHPAVFVSGVTRQAGQLLSHAWVEDDQGMLEAYGEPNNRRIFRVLFSYPEGQSAGAARSE